MIWITVITILLAGCGVAVSEDDGSAPLDAPKDYDRREPVEGQGQTPTERQAARTINGYVSPIDLTVDGEGYGAGGSESFYTRTWDALRKEADENGYADHELRILGRLGLSDFGTGMRVIGASSSFAFERNVVNGSFRVNLPVDYDGSPITLRAIRRVEVQLVPPSSSERPIKWCYALLSDQTFNPLEETSVVLNAFISVTTRYSCGSGSSFTIPAQLSEVTPGAECEAETGEEKSDEDKGS